MTTHSHPREAPLIRAKNIPRWLIARDLFLTLAAWVCIAQFMRHAIYLVYDYLSVPIFKLTHTQALTWFEIWYPLRGFLLFSAFLVLWIAFWGFYGARRARTERPAPQPPPLSIAEHAMAARVREYDLSRWQTHRIAIVNFDDQHKIISISRQDLAAKLATGTA